MLEELAGHVGFELDTLIKLRHRQPQLLGLMLSPKKDTWASGEIFDLSEFSTSKFALGSLASLERNLDDYAEKIKVQPYAVNPFDSLTEARRRARHGAGRA